MAGSPSWPAKLSLPGVEHAHPRATTSPKSGTRLMTCRRLLEIGGARAAQLLHRGPADLKRVPYASHPVGAQARVIGTYLRIIHLVCEAVQDKAQNCRYAAPGGARAFACQSAGYCQDWRMPPPEAGGRSCRVSSPERL